MVKVARLSADLWIVDISSVWLSDYRMLFCTPGYVQCTHLGPLVAYNPVSLTGTSKTRFSRWWLWIVFTEAFIYGGIFDVHTSHDSLFDSFFTCHGTLKRKN